MSRARDSTEGNGNIRDVGCRTTGNRCAASKCAASRHAGAYTITSSGGNRLASE